jgi:hypothetical protein
VLFVFEHSSAGAASSVLFRSLYWPSVRVTAQDPTVAAPERIVAASAAPVVPAIVGLAKRLPFALVIFISAFLLFQAELLQGKQVLPLFGGAPAVWSVCLLVYQLLFLAGYGYSHAIVSWKSLRGQLIVHSALLGVSILIMGLLGHAWSTPIRPGAGWGLQSDSDPTWAVARFLLGAIGLPFFLLSATSPLLQHWFAKVAPGSSPYRLYALSNVGSLLGLASYPLLVEPFLRLRTQGWIWAGGYALFCVCYLSSVQATASAPVCASPGDGSVAARVQGSRRLLWAGLAACASVLLLATTNLICQNVTSIPFLWALPLSLYLISFIVCFESDRLYRRAIFHPAFTVAIALVVLTTLPNGQTSFSVQLAAYSALLFAGCMVCHGEAARTRPGPESLTVFYFSIATGGALGGLFVSLIAPRIFPNYWEFPLAVLGCTALLLSLARRDCSSWWYTGRPSLALLVVSGAAIAAPVLVDAVWPWNAKWSRPAGAWAAGLLAAAAVVQYARERRKSAASASPLFMRAAARIALALITAGLIIPQRAEFYHVVAQSRNFYGILSVVSVKAENYLALRHGNIVHGFQYQDSERARLATGYYAQHTGANIVIRNWPHHPMRVGLIGMGVGTLAALAQPGDVFRFYEINPDVYKWSSGEHPYFTYLRDSPGQVEVILGDGRLSLAREAALGDLQQFDVLVLDAFSSDAIPMHLLTHEAFAIYEKHLRGPGSVIAVHISNLTLDLQPVVAGIAAEFGLHAVRVYPLDEVGPLSQSDWILLSRDAASLGGGELVSRSEPVLGHTRLILWTDDYCDLLHILRR